MRLAEL